MKGAGRPTSDMIRSRPVSRGTTRVSISSRAAAAKKKKKPEEPAPAPVPPSPGAPTNGAVGIGDSGDAGRALEAGVRVRTVVEASGEAVGSRRWVTTADDGHTMLGAVAGTPLSARGPRAERSAEVEDEGPAAAVGVIVAAGDGASGGVPGAESALPTTRPGTV